MVHRGVSRPPAVLFADLRGFTAASEEASPHEVVEALNAYLDAIIRAVIREAEQSISFMGDYVMALWGAPRPDPRTSSARFAPRFGCGT